ncbi:MAG TPA: MarR family winged helix-turn-helix transcriptional regulator [Bryobacteraceae bacterium]|jgi:DNA-binding MarR family transcriptional regulator|nr:MarR family winged helix-turn-helix transcriptional regulator [Bryobacteraceae bacterium]
MDISRKLSGPAFLLAQVGAHAASKFKERIATIGLTAPDAGILRLLAIDQGISQQDLSAKLGIHPSRLVAIVDELERRELLERKPNPEDRRQYALHLTDKGRDAFTKVGQIARQHQDALCASLTGEEREKLAELLRKIADEQGLTPGVHPGYRRLQPRKLRAPFYCE